MKCWITFFTSLCILSLGNSSYSCTWLNLTKMYLNRRLDHHSNTSLMTSSLDLCLDTCMYRSSCFSVNYERATKTCELLKVNSIGDAYWEFGYIHAGLEEWLQIRDMNPCSDKPCGMKQFCSPIWTTENSYECIDIEFDDCEEVYLVTGSNGVPDDQMTASSTEQNNTDLHGAHRARLNADSSWDPATESDPYIQVRFNKTEKIVGIVTQGAHNTEAWIEHYNVAYSVDCIEFEFVTNTEGIVKMFEGNVDSSTPKTNYFEGNILARCVRIYPAGFNGYIVMRFDVIGCS